MIEIERRIEALEEKVKKLSLPGLMNYSQAAEYIGTNSTWIKFLIDNKLIKLTFLPQYRKAKIAKVHLDEFIERLNRNDPGDKHLLNVFVRANTVRFNRYSKLKEMS